MRIGQQISNKSQINKAVNNAVFVKDIHEILMESFKAETKIEIMEKTKELAWSRGEIQKVYNVLNALDSYGLVDMALVLDCAISRYDKKRADMWINRTPYMLINEKPVKLYDIYQSLMYCWKKLREMNLCKYPGTKWTAFARYVKLKPRRYKSLSKTGAQVRVPANQTKGK